MDLTYLGTTMLLLDDGTTQVLFDPQVTRPSLVRFLFGNVSTNSSLVSNIHTRLCMTRVKGVVASHSHYDHVLDLGAFATLTGAPVYGSPSTLNVARGGDIGEDLLHDFTQQRRFSLGDFTIQVLDSVHSKPNAFNNDLGQQITKPLRQPCKMKDYKEGGSFDFLVSHPELTILIRPSFNFLPGQLDNVRADVILEGITHIHKEREDFQQAFFAQTLDMVGARTFIPLHWDNFFTPLEGPLRNWPFFLGDFHKDINLVKDACQHRGVAYRQPLPLKTIKLC